MLRKLLLSIVLLSLCLFSAAHAEDVVIPEDTKVIEAEAFVGVGLWVYGEDEPYPMFLTVDLPEGIERIESRAFADSGIWLINLPDSLNFIADDAFENCDCYAEVTYGSYAQQYCDRMGIRYSVEIAPDVTVIAAGQYEGSSMEGIELPEGIKRIESRAFADSALCYINFPRSLEYIAPDAFDGVALFDEEDEPVLCVSTSEGTVGEAYCEEHGIACDVLVEPELYIVELEFDPLSEVTLFPGQVCDGYHSGFVLYQWGEGRRGSGGSVNSYPIDEIVVSEEAQPYLSAGRSEEFESPAYFYLAAAADVDLGEGAYDTLVLPGAVTVRYTYLGETRSRTLDVKFIHKTMTMFSESVQKVSVGDTADYRIEAWTLGEGDAPLTQIEAFDAHWTIDGEPLDEEGCYYDICSDELAARVVLEEDGSLAHITWLTDGYYTLACADDNGYKIAEIEVKVYDGEIPEEDPDEEDPDDYTGE